MRHPSRGGTARGTSTASGGATRHTPPPPTPMPGSTAKPEDKHPSSAIWATLLMENRNGLVVDTETTHATGTAEREAAEAMVGDVPGCGRITLGADKAFDVAGHVAKLREMNVTPHVAQNTTNRASAIDGRTTRHPGYALSQRIRKRIEEAFGWIKVSGGLRKTRHRGLERVGWSFTFTAAAYNLIRIPKLLAT